MTQYKLFRLLKTIDRSELTEVEKFLASPFHDNHDDVQQLFKYLKKQHKDLSEKPPSKQSMHGAVYGKKPFKDIRIRKLMSRLTRALERFITVREVFSSEDAEQEILAKALTRRNDFHLFEQSVKSRIESLSSGPQGKGYFWEMSQLYQSLYLHPEVEKFSLATNRLLDLYHYYFECFMVLSGLQNGMESFIQKRVVQNKGSVNFADTAYVLAGSPMFSKEPIIRLFHQIFGLYRLVEPVPTLEKLRHLLFEQFDKLQPFEQRMTLKLLINHATPLSNNGSPQHTRFIFDLYRFGVEKGLLLDTGKHVNTLFFTNIVVAGNLAGELNWVEKFIGQYAPYLSENDREPAVRLSMSGNLYHRFQKEGSLDLLHSAQRELSLIPVRSPATFDLRGRSLQLRILFHLLLLKENTLEEVLNQVRNFERHLLTSPTYSESKKRGTAPLSNISAPC